ncbi:RagB/SusD family nutrient uptake outer membrane protein [Echinicola sp. CAU 1574]|uniref:RagB/SusD family nutrient uptake outer membrane protein n=1 Tax=Echinicola arenosa TaxID=2774144 RepID=A0ABR9AL90_9BACT|nr:RagB/SusD family nutrient uptake outer membrane protein [Echinicola arenosa]MBD8489475.1 RagB/SusD family nutrient uptake outer membrane protein [Echinicola arenosa]
MKKLPIYLALVGALSLNGCDGYLDRNPTDQLSADVFWQTKSDFDNALTAAYGSLQGDLYTFGAPNWDALTDNGYGQHNYWGSNGIVQGNIFPSSGGYISSIYSTAYQGIARVNIFLDKLETYEGTDIDATTKSQYEGEAKFIRGFFYFQLYMTYGSVPVVTQPLNLEDQFQAKNTSEEVFEQMKSDLTEAISQLQGEPYYNAGGHSVKSSAQALLLRALMYNAYDNSGEAVTSVLEEAKLLAADLMDGQYRLVDDVESVFRTGSQEGNEEIIFSVKFLAPDNATAMDQWFGDWLVVSPLQNLVDDFEYEDGMAFGESPMTDLDNPYENRDPRLLQTIFVDYVDWGGGNEHRPSNNRPTGFGVKKFLTPELIPYGYSTRSEQDWVMLRYADVLLMYAELENELSGPTINVYNAINEVRERSDMPNIPAGISQEEMRESIRHERRIELAFEGLRYYDLKRWKIAEEVLNNVDDGIIPYHFEERFYQWPLPQSEIDKSNGVLEQNPDY